jgi:hypothetical protein
MSSRQTYIKGIFSALLAGKRVKELIVMHDRTHVATVPMFCFMNLPP